ncbi:SusC/RagA family TonB-linked outer membrane protein [Dysgonomonas hofstadii]
MKSLLFFLFISIFCLSAENMNSQNMRVTLNQQEVQLDKVLNEIEKQTDYLFVYDKKVDTERKVSVNVNKTPLNVVLTQLFNGTNIKFVTEGSYIILSADGKARLQDIVQQNRKITGTVKEQNGDPIVGASVAIKGTTIGVMTDIDGNFSLTVPSNAKVISISFMGMKAQEVTLSTQSTYDIVLEDAAIAMTEVVVTALGIKKEAKSLSYNVQQLSGDAVNKVADANFVNNLNGKVAGVTINSSSSGTGGSSRVVMRGTKSIYGNNNALYVVDGIPMLSLSTEQPEGVFGGRAQTGDGISNINPEDIESISVLSGPSAAALYGSAAANGVVLVTTKKGQEGKLSLTVSNSTMFSAPMVLPKFQNTYGQSEQGSYYSWGEKLSTPSSYDPADFFQTGVNVSNAISLTTGTDKNQTYLSLGTVNSEGIVSNNDYRRYNLSVRNTSKFLNDKMTLDLGFMTSSVKEQNMLSQGLYNNPLVAVYLFPPGDDFSKVKVYERYNATRNFKTQYWPYGDLGMSVQNPYWITDRNMFINHKDRYMTNMSLGYEFAKGINLTGRAKLDQSNEERQLKFYASTNTTMASENGRYELNNISTRQIYGEAILNIERYFADNTLGLTANIGANIEDVKYDQDMYGGNLHGIPNQFTYANVNKSTALASQTGYHTQKQAVFASAQLGYRSMAYLDVTARNDWSSTLAGSNYKSFFYPTIGLSGIVTDIFNIGSDIMPYMKMRVSYSEVGNDPDPFLTIPTYSISGGYPVMQTRMPNPDLKPERTKSWEAGLNFMFFNSKLKLDATAYKSSTYNQFFEPPLSSTSGYSSVIVNAGKVDNKGIEISARYSDTFGKVNWSTGLTYSLNRNIVKELLNEWTNPITGEVISQTEIDMGGLGSFYKMILKEGQPMGDIYVNTLVTDEHGAIYIHPSDQTVSADPNNFIYAGNASPKYNLGWSNEVSWNGVSLSFLINARVGGVVVSNTQALMDAFGVSENSALARDAGGALVNGKLIPAKEYYQVIGSAGGTTGIGSMYIYSATNVRLGELTLGYDIPVHKWTNAVKWLNVSFIGRNLFFFYRKAPYDPEVTANTGTYYQGIDHFMMPSLRNLGFSVKAKF